MFYIGFYRFYIGFYMFYIGLYRFYIGRSLTTLYIVSKTCIFKDCWLFLRSLSNIGSSERPVGRISSKFRPNPH